MKTVELSTVAAGPFRPRISTQSAKQVRAWLGRVIGGREVWLGQVTRYSRQKTLSVP